MVYIKHGLYDRIVKSERSYKKFWKSIEGESSSTQPMSSRNLKLHLSLQKWWQKTYQRILSITMINKARLNLKDFSEQSQSSLEVCDYRTFIGLEYIIY